MPWLLAEPPGPRLRALQPGRPPPWGRSTARPRACSSSARPATSGASGPTTVRSIGARPRTPRARRRRPPATGTASASSSMPGLPGRGEDARRRRRWRQGASTTRAPGHPPPTTRTLISPPRRHLQGLLAVRPHRDVADRHAAQLLDAPDVRLGAERGRSPARGGALQRLLRPAISSYDRPRPGGRSTGGAGSRRSVRPRTRYDVAHPQPFQAGEHVELGQEQLRQTVDPGRVPQQHRVEPPAAALAVRSPCRTRAPARPVLHRRPGRCPPWGTARSPTRVTYALATPITRTRPPSGPGRRR